jgi:hypothetical protein
MYRVLHDFAIAPMDFRGLARNVGV